VVYKEDVILKLKFIKSNITPLKDSKKIIKDLKEIIIYGV
jgi:hypothetical protein